jgi:peptidoglycan/LPS O-acetylase OafA/YrhL
MPTKTPPAKKTKTTPATTAVVVPSRLPGLDGLRALAVTIVVLYHLTPGALVGGYIGVDVFFVISGFLITGLLLREKESSGSIHLPSFWKRRARRLLPALGLLVVACTAAAFVIGGDILVGLGKQVLGALTFSYNWLALAGGSSYFDDTTPELLRNLWSLAVEEQFYLVWPILVLVLVLVRRRTQLLVVVAIAVASALAMYLLVASGDPTRVYYGTDTHSFGLAVGAALAIATSGWAPQVLAWSRASRFWLPLAGLVGLAGIITLAIVMPDDNPIVYRGGLVVVALLGAITIAGAVVPGGFLGRLLDLSPIRWVGERSYGLYLWHWPVFVLVGAALPVADPDGAGGWMLGAVALALTVFCAAVSYRYVETPIRRDGFRATLRAYGRAWNPRRVRFATTAILTIAVLGLASLGVAGIVQGPAAGEAQTQIEVGQEAIDEEPPPPTDDVALPGGDQIVAVGDSVMLAAAPELKKAFPGIRIDAVVSRQMSQGPAIVKDLVDRGKMRPILVLGLGTNGPIDRTSVEDIAAIIGPDVQLVLVNVQAPRGWIAGNNKIFSKFASEQRSVELANWFDAIKPHLDVLSSDKVHPGGPTGGRIYSGAVRDALQRLAELPPLLGSNDYGLAPRPA